MNELALFAGAGGGILGGKLLGWRTVCAVEWEPYPASVLVARQNDGLLPPFPIWDDVQTFDGRPWRGIVDVVSGGFPCQDISVAGKGDGLEGERSGMWKHMARVVGEVRPRFVFVENSPMLTTRGGTRVIADLTALGYNSRWTVMGAADVGAPHQRDRIWIVGKQREMAKTSIMFSDGSNDNSRISMERKSFPESGNNGGSDNVAYTNCERFKESWRPITTSTQNARSKCSGEIMANTKRREREMGWDDGRMGWFQELGSQGNAGISNWDIEPDVGRVAHGVAARVDRLKAIGNGQVPLCAAEAWRILSEL